MSEKEKQILDVIKGGIEKLDQRKLDYLEGFVDGMTATAKRKEDEDGQGA